MGIEEIVQGLQANGLTPEQAIEELKKMLAEGKITQEDLDKAIAMLNGDAGAEAGDDAAEKAMASKYLGVEL